MGEDRPGGRLFVEVLFRQGVTANRAISFDRSRLMAYDFLPEMSGFGTLFAVERTSGLRAGVTKG